MNSCGDGLWLYQFAMDLIVLSTVKFCINLKLIFVYISDLSIKFYIKCFYALGTKIWIAF